MSDRSNKYVFGAALAGVALSGVAGIVDRAQAGPVTNAAFSFESSFSGVSGTTGTGVVVSSFTGATFGPLVAETGTGSAYGVHAAATTVYSVPAGNGSAHAFSSNNWAVGDYYQFTVPTTGIQGILVTFDQSGSSTGPAHYTLTASSDGTTFQTIGSYTVGFSFNTVNSTGGPTTSSGFATGTSNTVFSQSFDLSSITSFNNASGAIFRLMDADTVSLGGGTVATAGTDRVDNFVVSGTAVSGTPEPTALSLVGVAAVGMISRRRRQA